MNAKNSLISACIIASLLFAGGQIQGLLAQTFTKITTGNIVSDIGSFHGAAWGDYDNDGYMDLFVANYGGNNLLYRNNSDSTFVKVVDGNIVNDGGPSTAAAWGDYNNDGFIDLFVSNDNNQDNFLYKNNGNGTFTKIVSGPLVKDRGYSFGPAWADYDLDGHLDLFVGSVYGNNFLYHNNGDETFTKITAGSIVSEGGDSDGCAWGDYDNDGYPDLFVANGGNQNNYLYHNNRDGTFSKITSGNIVNDRGYSLSCAWGDYDNDGRLDLFVANRLGCNFLYRNNGDGTFAKVTAGSVVNDKAESNGCAWADYDNDGFLDLFVANWMGLPNFLYHNNGDGSFTPITTGSIVNDGGNAIGCAWADYDNDGFLDLFVSNFGSRKNLLYHNDGNSNNWLKLKLAGTTSNRSAIGAKVRIKTVGEGLPRWQMRQVSGGAGFGNQDLGAHFGLGSATNIDTIRIEWPSGIVQEFHNVPAKQTLTMTEAGVTEIIFTKITAGAIVNDGGNSYGPAWGDYDNDGNLDLFVANLDNQNNFLYRNKGDGSFDKVTTGPVVSDGGNSVAGTWADYDNDGDLDLFVANTYQGNFLYRNEGRGIFTRILTGDIPRDSAFSVGAAWADYDNDGHLDLFVANGGGARNENNFLYHNNGDGTFTKITAGSIVNDGGWSGDCAWADFDNDGDQDLVVSNMWDTQNFFYRNNGDGTFTRITTGPVATDRGQFQGCAWGDYDNDGFLDLFVANGAGLNNLYHNNGNGTFTRITTGGPTGLGAVGSTWGDYDNDGWLDLFVANRLGKNYLFRNNGNGTFTKITAGDIVNDSNASNGAVWGDYDNDGFLDLFVANWDGQNNCLYHNNGNSHNWIKIKLVGTTSNRSAIGAKVRVKTISNGSPGWQMRQISGGAGIGNQDLCAHFGLGSATNIDTIRIEWPSGKVQELANVAAKQVLTVTEPEPPVLQIQPDGGLFTNSIIVRLITRLTFGEIRYTLDNSEPIASSPRYTNAFELTVTTTIKARMFFSTFPITEVVTATFARVYAIDDGIPAAWREKYFGPNYLTDPRVAANADPDGDGAINLEEFLAGTDPTDPNSVLRIRQIRLVPLITWDSVSNKLYRVLRNDDLTATNWIPLAPPVRATNEVSSFIDLEAPGKRGFYQIQPLP
jgi:hypothetical protein